ncbi:MAG: FumA C-terminus/TtdB family hydratase beta subunit [Alphaproteobacteria bacterium]|nr:FumA C-terminus/TtdB family hydratase beta subunit [Alphaproteobacteria bacterium]
MYPIKTEFDKIDEISIENRGDYLFIPSNVFEELSYQAFKRLGHFLRTEHLKQIKAIVDDSHSSENERFVCKLILRNAVRASKGVFPICQDTGTAIIFGEKGNKILTDGDEDIFLSNGVKKAYLENNFRYSQNKPITSFSESNTKNNLPACIDLKVSKGDEYQFLMIAKGGGSANKTFLFQENRSLLEKEKLLDFLQQKIKDLGVSACPPYHLSVVLGGLSAEQNLKYVKLASAKAMDCMPKSDIGFRDIELEKQIFERANQIGLGAQFGGKHFCLDVRCIRLARHGASLPVGIGVSCVADRNILAKINKEGVFIEKLETDPEQFLGQDNLDSDQIDVVDLDCFDMKKKCVLLSKYNVGDKLKISGTLIVARDIAHARFREMITEGKSLPDYLFQYPVYYAGPAKTPKGEVVGSLGPTTAGRMDSYVELFQRLGASLIMIAKGNRSKSVLDSCLKYGGFYLGTPGGIAAEAASHIVSCECIDFDDLGMEAVYKIKVKDMPVFIIIDNKGNDFYEQIKKNPSILS